MRQKWSRHFPQRRKNALLWNTLVRGCNWRTFHGKRLLGRSALSLPYSALATWADPKLLTGFWNLCMHGWILHPWQHVLYIPLYSKQWEIKHWMWGNVRFQVGGWRRGKTASSSGNLSDGMPNAMHLRKGVDRDSLLRVMHKKCLSLPVSFSLPCPCLLIACISAYKRCIHTQAHRVILGMKQKT